MQHFETAEDYLAINQNLNPERLRKFLEETNNTIGKLDVELIKKTNLKGPDFAWHREDVPLVIADARSKGIAVGGWQAQYRFPNAICDLYWVYFGNEFRDESETWDEYVQRCANKSLEAFNNTINSTDIHADAIKSFQYITDLNADEKETLDDYQYFEVYLRAKEDERKKAN